MTFRYQTSRNKRTSPRFVVKMVGSALAVALVFSGTFQAFMPFGASAANTYTSGAAGSGFVGGSTAGDGRIIFAPFITSNIGIYNPSTDTFTSGPAHGEGGNAFNGATTADDGNIILSPQDSLNVGIFDPSTDTYTSGATHGEGAGAFTDAVTADDGRVIFAPFGSANVGIYDPSTDTYTSGPAHGEGANAFYGATKLSDGRIVFTPFDSDNIGIFDPSTDTYTSGATHGEGTNALIGGGAIDDNGRVIFSPYDSDNIGIYDPSTDTYTSGPAHGEGGDAFQGAVATGDGRIVFAPHLSDNVGIYDPSTDTFTSGPAHGEGSDAFAGAVETSGEDIIFVPRSSSNVGIFTPTDVPNAPTNQTPIDGATDVATSPTLTADSFSDPDSDSHQASQWQVADDAAFASGDIVYDSDLTGASLESIQVPNGNLSANTTYYWRVRYQDNAGATSNYSSFTSFTTISAGVTVTESGGSTDITEGGTTDTYDVVLDSQSNNDVTINISTDSGASTDVSSLTFTSANWDTAQTVTVTAVDDARVEGDHTVTITHTASSVDGDYDGISVANVTANVTDNDNGGGGGLATPSDRNDSDNDEGEDENEEEGEEGNEANNEQEDTENEKREHQRVVVQNLQERVNDLMIAINQLEERQESFVSNFGVSDTDSRLEKECSFARDLWLGMTGVDVRCLQETMNELDFILAEMGSGSPGNETNYFGQRTRDAVKRYQGAYAEEILEPLGLTLPTGYFGARTRASLEDLMN